MDCLAWRTWGPKAHIPAPAPPGRRASSSSSSPRSSGVATRSSARRGRWTGSTASTSAPSRRSQVRKGRAWTRPGGLRAGGGGVWGGGRGDAGMGADKGPVGSDGRAWGGRSIPKRLPCCRASPRPQTPSTRGRSRRPSRRCRGTSTPGLRRGTTCSGAGSRGRRSWWRCRFGGGGLSSGKGLGGRKSRAGLPGGVRVTVCLRVCVGRLAWQH
jgi:hypothetical protein